MPELEEWAEDVNDHQPRPRWPQRINGTTCAVAVSPSQRRKRRVALSMKVLVSSTVVAGGEAVLKLRAAEFWGRFEK
jgi:hypothetical protein